MPWQFLLYRHTYLTHPATASTEPYENRTKFPLGPFPVDKLTVEFLCSQGICITAEDSSSGTLTKTTRYGTYETDGHKAIIEGVTMTLRDHDITFIEARLEGKTLFLLWRIEDSVYPFTTPMQHLSAYE